MANSKIPAVLLNDTLNLQRRRFNQLLDSVGDVSTLKTTAGDVTAAVNELYDSIGVIGLGSLNTSAKTLRQAIKKSDEISMYFSDKDLDILLNPESYIGLAIEQTKLVIQDIESKR